jgi:hypothetical protein
MNDELRPRAVSAAFERLCGLPRPEFYRVVGDDLRGHSDPATAEALRSPELFGRWVATLDYMRVNVQGQIEARAADAEAEELDAAARGDDNQAWAIRTEALRKRAASLRFRTRVEEGLHEAALLRWKRELEAQQ